MGNETQNLKLKVSADTSQAKGALKLLGGSIGDIKSGLLSMLGPAGMAASSLAAVGTAFVKLAKEAMNYTLSVTDLASAIGSTTEEASALIEIADDMRVPISALEMGFKSMARNGIEPSLNGLADMATRFQAIQDPTQKVKFLTDNFGRSGMELARVLEMDEEALRNYLETMGDGQIITKEEGERAKALYAELDQLEDAFRSLTLEIGTHAIPVITDLLNVVNESIEADREWSEAHEDFVDALKKSGEYVESVTGGLVRLKNGTIMTRAEFIEWSKTNGVVQTSLRGINEILEDVENKWIDILSSPATKQLYIKVNTTELDRAWDRYFALLHMDPGLGRGTGERSFYDNGTPLPQGGGSSGGDTFRDYRPYESGGGLYRIDPVTGRRERIGRAQGGPLTGFNEVGEEGTEGIVNGTVIPHGPWEWLKKALRIKPRHFDVGNPGRDGFPWPTTIPDTIEGQGDRVELASSSSSSSPKKPKTTVSEKTVVAEVTKATVATAEAQVQISERQLQETVRSNDNLLLEVKGMRRDIAKLNDTISTSVRDAVERVI